MSDYWKVCIEEAFGDLKITATQEQIDNLIEWVEGGHENYGMMHGHDCIPDPVEAELKETKRQLGIEVAKVHCEECNGQGRIISHGPCHSSNSECSKCRGEGRHSLRMINQGARANE